MLSLLLTIATMAPLQLATTDTATLCTNNLDADQQQASLGFASKRVKFDWDRIIPLGMTVDGLEIKTIFFNKRGMSRGPLKGATFGTRAQVEVENKSLHSKNTGYAVAVFDEQDNLLGVASGGNTLWVVKPGKTKTFNLNFFQVRERLQRGSYFVVSIELVD